MAELARGESQIYKAMLKYGYTSFSLTLLEIVNLPEDTTPEEKADVLESTEQKYLDELDPEYNILKKAGSNQGTKMSEETRQRMSAAKKGKASHGKGKTMSDKARNNMSANSAMSKVVYMLDHNMTLVNTYSSITECSLATGISRFRIGRSLDTMKLVNGYYFTSTLTPLTLEYKQRSVTHYVFIYIMSTV